jgi:hypothetical protein
LDASVDVGGGKEPEVCFARQRASQAADGIFHAALLPGTVGIAEEGLDAEGFVQPVMLGELGSVVEADGFAHRSWKLAEATADGAGGADSFAIDRPLDDVEAGLSFVQNQQALTVSGEQHEVGFPVAGHLAALDLGGPFGERPPLFDEAGGAAAALPAAPAPELVARQPAMPVILPGGAVIDETID